MLRFVPLIGNLYRAAALLSAFLAVSFSGSAQAQNKLIMQLATASPVTSYVNLYVAQAAGFFKEEKLDVELRYVAGGPLATQIVINGGADVAGVTVEGLLVGYDKGLRGKFIYARTDQLIYFVAVPKNSPIRSVADIKGKRIGVINMGSSSITIARSMLRGAGVDPEKDVTFVPTGGGPAALAALDSGQVEALSLIDAMYGAYESAGREFRYLKHPAIGNVGNGGYLVTEKSIQEKRPVLVSLIRALIKAHLFMKENPQASLKIYWSINPSARGPGSEAEALERSMIELRFQTAFFAERPLSEIGKFDIPGMKSFISALKSEGAIPAEVPVEQVIQQDLIDEANKFDPEPVRQIARKWK